MAGNTPNSKQVSSGPLKDIKYTGLEGRFFQCLSHLEMSSGNFYCFVAREKII